MWGYFFMQEESQGSFFSVVLKGISVALTVTLIGVFIFAFVIKIACLNSGVIKAVNQFIKILSIFLACNFSIKSKGGFVKGAIIGLLSTLVTYLIFALMGSGANFDGSFILDLVFGLIVGAISGTITVNLKRE